MGKQLLAYKVVYQGADEFKSAYPPIQAANVTYNRDVWSIPTEGFGPLAAFDTLDNVKSFLCAPRSDTLIMPYSWAIWHCEVELSSECSLWCLGWYKKRRYNIGFVNLPLGTLLCDRIKLISEVK